MLLANLIRLCLVQALDQAQGYQDGQQGQQGQPDFEEAYGADT